MTHGEYRGLCGNSADTGQRALFDEYYCYVKTIVYSRLRTCGRREDIEECISDVFVDVFRDINSDTAPETDITGFIGTVARRRAADYFRRLSGRAGRTISLDAEESPEYADGTDIETDSELNERRRLLLDAVESLGEPDSVIVLRRYYYGTTYAEISRDIGMNPAAVRVRAGRALKKLKKMLEKKGITL